MKIYNYETIGNNIIKNKSWIDYRTNLFCSKELTLYNYVCLATKYNTDKNAIEAYLITTKEKPENSYSVISSRNKYGVFKISLKLLFKQHGTPEHDKEIEGVNVVEDIHNEWMISYGLGIELT